MKPRLFLALLMAPLAACAPWPPQSAGLDPQALSMSAPPLMPLDQLAFASGNQALSSGAASQEQAADLRSLAAGI
jgi:hypothetical protein